jgi:hypothetical protein
MPETDLRTAKDHIREILSDGEYHSAIEIRDTLRRDSADIYLMLRQMWKGREVVRERRFTERTRWLKYSEHTKRQKITQVLLYYAVAIQKEVE